MTVSETVNFQEKESQTRLGPLACGSEVTQAVLKDLDMFVSSLGVLFNWAKMMQKQCNHIRDLQARAVFHLLTMEIRESPGDHREKVKGEPTPLCGPPWGQDMSSSL